MGVARVRQTRNNPLQDAEGLTMRVGFSIRRMLVVITAWVAYAALGLAIVFAINFMDRFEEPR